MKSRPVSSEIFAAEDVVFDLCASYVSDCSYESMKCLCDRYNRAIDSVRQLVSDALLNVSVI